MSKNHSGSKASKNPKNGKPADPKPAAAGNGNAKPEKKGGKKKKGQFREGFEQKAKLTHKRGEAETRIGGVPVQTTLSSRDTGAFGSVRIFGHPLTNVLRALGKNGKTVKEVRAIMNGIGLEAVRDSSIATCVAQGRGGDERAVRLDKAELAKLLAAAK